MRRILRRRPIRPERSGHYCTTPSVVIPAQAGISAATKFNTGYTLIELSIVLLVLALLASAAMRYANANGDSSALAANNATLDIVETALQNFWNNNGRLPCPADLTSPENTSTFGNETDALGDGLCTGYNYINSGSDPDAADPLYDAATAGKVVVGAVPVNALKIADKYAYDAWGNKIFYSVDLRITNNNAYKTYLTVNTVIGAIAVKKTAGDTLANALTYKGIYALISAGKNAHGAYPRNLSIGNPASVVRVNAGSVNTDELDNCHCDSNAAATAFNRIFIQKTKTSDSTSFNNNFDDVVRFKNRGMLANVKDLQ